MRNAIVATTRIISTVVAAAGIVASPLAWAAEDRFDPQVYSNGGFAPAKDAAWQKECGTCHFAYLPGMLPARSWKVVFDNPTKHFGENLNLPADTMQKLAKYAADNAADKVDYRGSERMLKYLSDTSSPARITDLPMMGRFHVSVKDVLKSNSTATVRKLTNCNDCHLTAATGSFANRDLIVPGVTKVVGSHGVF